MVLCCFDSLYDAEEGAYFSKPSGGYPGYRRFAKTSVTEDPSEDYPPPSAAPSCDTVVAVTVPSGVYPGDVLAVRSPDGSRTVHATVPPGMTYGSTFMVEFPPPLTPAPSQSVDHREETPSFAQSLDEFIGNTPAAVPPVSVSLHSTKAQPDGTDFSTSANSSDALGDDSPPITSNPSLPKAPSIDAPGQKYLLVNVPPGTRAGATLYVTVPGENRTLAAQVPPNVTSFRVAYTPMESPSSNAQQSNRTQSQPLPSGGVQKLLLVHVPPGTGAGDTLHVAVPNEPGRILAAQVPMSNLKQFHVAYQPRLQTNQGYSPASNSNARQSYEQQHNQPNHRAGSNNDGGAGDYLMPVVGAAALGTAAYATYNHFSRQDS